MTPELLNRLLIHLNDGACCACWMRKGCHSALNFAAAGPTWLERRPCERPIRLLNLARHEQEVVEVTHKRLRLARDQHALGAGVQPVGAEQRPISANGLQIHNTADVATVVKDQPRGYLHDMDSNCRKQGLCAALLAASGSPGWPCTRTCAPSVRQFSAMLSTVGVTCTPGGLLSTTNCSYSSMTRSCAHMSTAEALTMTCTCLWSHDNRVHARDKIVALRRGIVQRHLPSS